MASRVEIVNTEILRQCREQSGLSVIEVAKKIPKIEEIEKGIIKPTFKQLDTFASLYKVPRWVFISEKLPDKYKFDIAVPAFRQFSNKNADIFSESKIRGLIAKVERFRELILELREDIGEAVDVFDPPEIGKNPNPINTAKLIRNWLKLSDDKLEFSQWKTALENKGIFVFLTSKYKGWSHVGKKSLRGLALYHETLPVIIINDSDARKAQSFTLFHELGHLLSKQSAINNWKIYQSNDEKWCNDFAENLLMPTKLVRYAIKEVNDISDLDAIKIIAKALKVSPYACLVRLLHLRIINQERYNSFEARLKTEYERIQKKLKESDFGPPRDRPKEILNQYGTIYTKTVFQAYQNKEIGLHKLANLLDLKYTSYVLQMEALL